MKKNESEIYYAGFIKGYETALHNIIGLTKNIQDALKDLINETPKNKIIEKIKMYSNIKMYTAESNIDEKTT